MDKKIKYFIFTLFCLFWLDLALLSFILALIDFFYIGIILGYIVIIIGLVLYLVWKEKSRVANWFNCCVGKNNLFSLKIILLILLSIILLSVFTTPTLFSGRDQGLFSEAAIRLSQNHQLSFYTPASKAFFQIYGPGKALNFPGFYYQENGSLTPNFPLVYISWLAMFYSIFNLPGLIIANAVLFFIFVLSFYFLIQIFFNQKLANLSLIFLFTTFPFFWFFKYTLSENITMALLWLGILQLVLYLKNKNYKNESQKSTWIHNLPKSARHFYKSINFNLITGIVSFSLLFFTRIEGIAFFGIALVMLILYKRTLPRSITGRQGILLFASIFTIIFSLNLTQNISFYKEIAKALITSNDTFAASSFTFSDIHIIRNTIIFYLYGFFGFLIFGLIAIIKKLVKYFRKKELRKKLSLDLLPFLIVLPTFFYIFKPHISDDHPWMIRRFVFSLLPVLIFYSFFVLNKFYNWKNFWFKIIVLALLVLNLSTFIIYFPFSENRLLLPQVKNLAQDFSDKDLILIDRLATGDGFSMIAAPLSFLYNKNAVYFFNTEDLKKIDRNNFDNIYLITPEKNIYFYEEQLGKQLIFVKDYSLKTRRLEIKKELSLPKKKNVEVQGKIFKVINQFRD